MNSLILTSDEILFYTTRDKITQAIREATYKLALKLIRRIDADLTTGRGHYRNRAGKLLRTLDEVVSALVADDLASSRRLTPKGELP